VTLHMFFPAVFRALSFFYHYPNVNHPCPEPALYSSPAVVAACHSCLRPITTTNCAKQGVPRKTAAIAGRRRGQASPKSILAKGVAGIGFEILLERQGACFHIESQIAAQLPRNEGCRGWIAAAVVIDHTLTQVSREPDIPAVIIGL
jgi:hypothetical protein